MADILTSFNTRRTPQAEQADPRQVRNSAGGHVFELPLARRVRRFLTLGTEGGTYYVNARDLTRDNATAVVQMAETDHAALVDLIVDVSVRGAAPKVQPALFALAIASAVGDPHERRQALARLPEVARTGTHLFVFAGYVEQFRGWGPQLRNGIGAWYWSMAPDRLAYQAVKYRQREGWTHRDLLRLAHPDPSLMDPARRATLAWIVGNAVGDDTPRIIHGFLAANEPGADVPTVVREYGLPWEALPDAALTDRAVWDALLDNGVPQTALMRQLPRLTRLGMLPAFGGRSAEVAAQLADSQRLRSGRVHPLAVLNAHATYAAGRSQRGAGTWTPNTRIVDALDAAFYAAFDAVRPAGKRTMVALDVSGSMTWDTIAGMSLTPRDASAALALVTLATEPESATFAFAAPGGRSDLTWRRGRGISPLPLSPRQRLSDAVGAVSDLPFGATDCGLPMTHATEQRLEVDTFVIYTDSETWAGPVHPHQALAEYRQRSGIDARLVVVGMTSTGFTIADPDDAGSLDVVGFDVNTPALISDFSAGRL